jgi:threonine/homoserine/homoserine lactone efflux protein
MIAATYFSYLLQGMGLGATAGASPGSFQTYLINQTLVGGWRRGSPIAFAPLVSDIPIILVILLLLNQLPTYFLRLISLAGGLFALYIAWGLWRQWRRSDPIQPTDPDPVARGNSFWRGVVMNLLSPGPYTFWALINGPILISALRQSWVHAAAFLVGFYGVFISTMLVIVFVFHQARRLGPEILRALTLGSILILVIFGLVLIYRSLA